MKNNLPFILVTFTLFLNLCLLTLFTRFIFLLCLQMKKRVLHMISFRSNLAFHMTEKRMKCIYQKEMFILLYLSSGSLQPIYKSNQINSSQAVVTWNTFPQLILLHCSLVRICKCCFWNPPMFHQSSPFSLQKVPILDTSMSNKIYYLDKQFQNHQHVICRNNTIIYYIITLFSKQTT